MPLYEVTLEQSYFGQQCINNFSYQSDTIASGTSGAYLAVVGMGAIADDDTAPFAAGTILGALQIMQSSAVTFVQMIAKNPYSNTDFFTYAFPSGTVGLNSAGQGLSPTQAFGFTSDKTRADVRRAQKRFVGLTEGDVNAGGLLTADFKTFAAVLATAMGNPNSVTEGGVTNVFTPYVFGLKKTVQAPPKKPKYALYPTEAEQLEHIAKINQYIVKEEVRTQTSRQYKRGS